MMTSGCTTQMLQIGEVRLAEDYGKIGFTFCPEGTGEDRSASGRDMPVAYSKIERWDAAACVVLETPARRNDPAATKLGKSVYETRTWHYLPLCDEGLPDPAFDNIWQASGEELRAVLRAGFNVLIQCETNLGGGGLAAVRLLIELGMPPGEAAKAVCALDPGAIETPAEFDYIMELKAVPEYVPPRSRDAMLDRASGAMLGLASGDALRVFNEACATDPLSAGEAREDQWSGATAMMLALADSLLAHDAFDAGDFMNRLDDWYETGAYSCTGHSLDIGSIVRSALQRWKASGDPIAGSASPRCADSGSLARMAPVVVRHWSDRTMLIDVARRQSQTTHGMAEVADACVALAEIMVDALAGLPRSEVLRPRVGHYTGKIATVLAGSWRGKLPTDLVVSGRAAQSLEAALWCVGRTGNFHDAVKLAADLGEGDDVDSNSIAAITGQLAGAIYGPSEISTGSERLAWGDRISERAHRLFAASWPE